MTVVVADSSPLNYLTLIGSIELRHQLYGGVLVPEEVILELRDPAAPADVRNWAEGLPNWVDVRSLASTTDSGMLHLDAGERAAIILAQSQVGALLLIDEIAGRAEAQRRGIPNTGTLGVLRAGALKGLLDLPSALARLLETNFRISMTLVHDLLAERRNDVGGRSEQRGGHEIVSVSNGSERVAIERATV